MNASDAAVALAAGYTIVAATPMVAALTDSTLARKTRARAILGGAVWPLVLVGALVWAVVKGLPKLWRGADLPGLWRAAFPKVQPPPLTDPTADELTEFLTDGPAGPPEEPRTFIVAPTRARAVAWCQANAVRPTAKTTVILSGRLSDIDRAVRGHSFRSADRIVYLAKRSPELVEILAPAFFTADVRPLEVDAS